VDEIPGHDGDKTCFTGAPTTNGYQRFHGIFPP
jgi:hypothetical protein